MNTESLAAALFHTLFAVGSVEYCTKMLNTTHLCETTVTSCLLNHACSFVCILFSSSHLLFQQEGCTAGLGTESRAWQIQKPGHPRRIQGGAEEEGSWPDWGPLNWLEVSGREPRLEERAAKSMLLKDRKDAPRILMSSVWSGSVYNDTNCGFFVSYSWHLTTHSTTADRQTHSPSLH